MLLLKYRGNTITARCQAFDLPQNKCGLLEVGRSYTFKRDKFGPWDLLTLDDPKMTLDVEEERIER
jgi:hypothetical protein